MANKLALKKVRIGKINYVNTVPFYHGFSEMNHVDICSTGSPSEINQAMRNGEIDIAPVSSLEYAMRFDEYLIFPELCVGSRDFARSVLLLSQEKINGLDGQKIVLTNQSFSSQALLKILLHFRYGFKNSFEVSDQSLDDLLARNQSVLSIGNEALFFKPNKFVYKYDLSELWWSWTNLPFCFALWVVRKKFYELYREETVNFFRELKAVTERNLLNLEQLIKESLEITIADERFTSVFGYLFNLSYLIDDEVKKGLLLFYRYANDLGILPHVPELNFIEGA